MHRKIFTIFSLFCLCTIIFTHAQVDITESIQESNLQKFRRDIQFYLDQQQEHKALGELADEMVIKRRYDTYSWLAPQLFLIGAGTLSSLLGLDIISFGSRYPDSRLATPSFYEQNLRGTFVTACGITLLALGCWLYKNTHDLYYNANKIKFLLAKAIAAPVDEEDMVSDQ